MGRARSRSTFIKPACGISPSICKAKSHMRIGAADKRNSNRDLRPSPNFRSKHGSQKPPKLPDSLPRLGATVQESASLLPDALTPLSPLGPVISGASPVGGMRDGEIPEYHPLFCLGPCISETLERNRVFVMQAAWRKRLYIFIFYPLRMLGVSGRVWHLFSQQV